MIGSAAINIKLKEYKTENKTEALRPLFVVYQD